MSHPYQLGPENEVANAEPLDLTLLLHEKAIELLDRCLQAKTGIPDHTDRVEKIIRELQRSLDVQAGGDVAVNLNRLYVYMLERVPAAKSGDMAATAEIRGLIQTLYEGWLGVRAQLHSVRATVAVTSSEAVAAGFWG